jgi:hypothetical protein
MTLPGSREGAKARRREGFTRRRGDAEMFGLARSAGIKPASGNAVRFGLPAAFAATAPSASPRLRANNFFFLSFAPSRLRVNKSQVAA